MYSSNRPTGTYHSPNYYPKTKLSDLPQWAKQSQFQQYVIVPEARGRYGIKSLYWEQPEARSLGELSRREKGI